MDAYKAYLARADAPPQGALDGRGVLSDGRLAEFCRFFMAASRDGLDLSALKLTHHRMRDLGQQKLNLSGSEAGPGLAPVTQAGFGQVQDKHKQRLQEIILALNDLFEGEITDGDAVAYVDTVFKEKMLESDLLRSQAVANTKEQFGNSPNLGDELMNAIMDAMAAHQAMSRQP